MNTFRNRTGNPVEIGGVSIPNGETRELVRELTEGEVSQVNQWIRSGLGDWNPQPAPAPVPFLPPVPGPFPPVPR